MSANNSLLFNVCGPDQLKEILSLSLNLKKKKKIATVKTSLSWYLCYYVGGEGEVPNDGQRCFIHCGGAKSQSDSIHESTAIEDWRAEAESD